MIIDCHNCAAYVEADKVGGYEYPAAKNELSGRFQLLRCRKCNNPILVRQDNIGNLADGDIWDTPLVLFPSREIRPNPNAPKLITAAYEEAGICYRAKAYTAAAILCRKTLEGICVHYNIHERNLIKSLEKMKVSGLIDERLFEWTDVLRHAGNEAVHDVNITISKDDAWDMLVFTNAILDYLFSFRDQFEQFKKRRNQKAQ